MELKSGMTKPEEFDSSILLLTEPLVIWPDWDCPAGMGVGERLHLACWSWERKKLLAS